MPRRARPRARRHVLHRAHERPELVAGMAARAGRRVADAEPAPGGQRRPGRRWLVPQPVPRSRGDRRRAAAARDRRRRVPGASGDLDVEPRQRARPVRLADLGGRRPGLGARHVGARPRHRPRPSGDVRTPRRQPRGGQPPPGPRRVRRDRRGGDARLPDVRELGARARSTPTSCRSSAPSRRRCAPSRCSPRSGVGARCPAAARRRPGSGPTTPVPPARSSWPARTRSPSTSRPCSRSSSSVGATGALLWCFADYAEQLWDRPPLDPGGAIHERHFGLVRPDGTLKPHAEVVRRFAATRSDGGAAPAHGRARRQRRSVLRRPARTRAAALRRSSWRVRLDDR